MSVKLERDNMTMQRIISTVLRNEIRDSQVGAVTVTSVDITNDYSYATVFVSMPSNQERIDNALAGLERSKGYIKNQVAKQMKLRKMPELMFKYDSSIDQGNRIDQLLSQLNNK